MLAVGLIQKSDARFATLSQPDANGFRGFTSSGEVHCREACDRQVHRPLHDDVLKVVLMPMCMLAMDPRSQVSSLFNLYASGHDRTE